MLRTTVSDLYVAKSTLWVEDHLTRVFLNELWGDRDLRVVAAGGREGVAFLVQGAPPALAGKRVVGFVDRDFSPDNQQAWTSPDTLILRTPAHEIENHLLDFAALSAVSRKESPAEIEQAARTFAASLKWWMVCKTVRHRINGEVTAYFPKEPPPPPDVEAPASQQAAAAYIADARFWKAHQDVLRGLSRAHIEQRVEEIGADYDRHLASGEWVRSFSGKEIFRHLRTVMRGLRERTRGGTAAENDENFAVLIARQMRASSSSSAQVFASLRAALRSRAGLPP
jgi:hypothetical protein